MYEYTAANWSTHMYEYKAATSIRVYMYQQYTYWSDAPMFAFIVVLHFIKCAMPLI